MPFSDVAESPWDVSTLSSSTYPCAGTRHTSCTEYTQQGSERESWGSERGTGARGQMPFLTEKVEGIHRQGQAQVGFPPPNLCWEPRISPDEFARLNARDS